MKVIIEESSGASERSRAPTMKGEKAPLLEDRRRQRKDLTDSQKRSDSEGVDRVRNVNRTITVEPVVVLFYISFNASVPVMQQFIYDRYAQEFGVEVTDASACQSENKSSPAFLRQQMAQAASSRMMIALALACVIPALISTLLLGPYSDQAGRKVAMLPALAGEVMRMVVNAVVIYYELPLWVMLISFFLDGLVGSAGCVMMSCFAYLSDITTHKQRSSRILILEVCMGVGVMGSQVGVGHMIAALGYFWPMFTIAVMNIFNFFYVLFLLPESLDRDPNAKFFSWHHFKKPFQLYIVDDWKERRWKLQLVLLTFALFIVVELGTNEITTLYLLNSPLCWDSIFVGYYNGVTYLLKNAGSIVLLRLIYVHIGDIGMVLFGFVSGVAYNITLSQAVTITIAFLSPVAGLGMQLILPMLRSISSKLVQPEEQGSLFATQGWMQLLGSCLGSLFFNTIYAKTLFLVHGFVFMVSAVLLAVGFFCGLGIMYGVRKEIQQAEEFATRRAMVKQFIDRKMTLRTASFM